jgi:hypothetical protein
MDGNHGMTPNAHGRPAVISETIRFLTNKGITTHVELAELAGISDSSVGRYATDQSQPSFDTVRCWVWLHPRIEARQAFAECLIPPTKGRVFLVDGAIAGDVNGDGRATIDDVMDGAIRVCSRAQATLEQARAAQADGQITETELVHMLAAGNELKRVANVMVAAATNAVVRRKKARVM